MIKQHVQNRGDWKSGSVIGISFIIVALSIKGSIGRKACENFSGVILRLFVNSEGDACRHDDDHDNDNNNIMEICMVC